MSREPEMCMSQKAELMRIYQKGLLSRDENVDFT